MIGRAIRPASDDTRLEEAGVWCARLADGSMSPVEQAAFTALLESDQANAAAFDRTAATWQAAEGLAGSPGMIAMRANALESARRANQRRWTRGGGIRTLAAVAATLVVAVIVGATWTRYVPKAFVTNLGERRIVALSDGSKISLDADTEVDVRFLGDRRQLWLKRGRAKFDVAKDPLRPFSVAAGHKVIVATGTQFSVELINTQVRVVLYEGHVAVLQDSGGGRPASPVPLAQSSAPGMATPVQADQVLTPGRELIVASVADQARVVQADVTRSLSWESGQLVFTDEPLASAVEQVNRYAAQPIAVGDPRAAAIPISGIFTAGDTDAFVNGVTAVFPVKVTSEGGVRTLVSAARPKS